MFNKKDKTQIQEESPELIAKGLFRGFEINEEFAAASIRSQERIDNRFIGDIRAKDILDKSIGLIDLYARKNAYAASQQKIRLYRKSSNTPTSIISKMMRAGKLGHKAMSFATDGNVVEVTNNPVLDHLARPNPVYPGQSLETASFYYRFLTGNSYHYMDTESNNGRITEWVLPSQFVAVTYSPVNLIDSYWFGRSETNQVKYDPNDIIHYRNGSSRDNPLLGQGDIEPLLREAELMRVNLNHDIYLIENMNRPDGIWEVNANTTDEQIKSAYKELDKRSRGWAKSVKPFISRGMKYLPVSHNPKDLQSIEKINLYEKRLRFAFGIPESMADSNSSTYASALIASEEHGRWIYGKLLEDAAYKSEYLLPFFGLDPEEYCFVYDSPLTNIEQVNEERLLALHEKGIISLDEVRAELGYGVAQ